MMIFNVCVCVCLSQEEILSSHPVFPSLSFLTLEVYNTILKGMAIFGRLMLILF